MDLIPRRLRGQLLRMAEWFPIVSVTGPRQSGKSTLVKDAFGDYECLNLEDPATRAAAEEDPVGFIRSHPGRLVIDEAQRVPDLFSVLQVVSDERDEVGQFVLLGSQNFLMSRRIGQSLAGRVGLATLLPLSFGEAGAGGVCGSLDEFILRGGYPRLLRSGMPTPVFFQSYLDTYVNRDVAGELDVRNLASFRRMLGLCAQRAGGLLNVSDLASDAGVSFQTAKSWLSILQESFVIYLLPAYAANEGKRLRKSPKLYFYDTGLLCHLLDLRDEQDMRLSAHFGAIVENFVLIETLKSHLNKGEEARLFYYRDDSKREIDLIDEGAAGGGIMVEVKAGETYRDKFAGPMRSVGEELGFDRDRRVVVYRGSESFEGKTCRVLSLADYVAGL